ncbi:SDR family oxidoreductase [Demequina sp. NBRC 110054]|uniref:SDR family oxidoreductase n=1 Tax=Demequina sp. NBRC 110054 TaxID=1570343 RepID=UPI000A00447B|nr:SDR family oxidoreductase [Demequina sp. NBRC 110054]
MHVSLPDKVAIVGGAGKVARRLIPLLVARGIDVVPLVRRQEQATELESIGVSPRLLDIESASADEWVEALRGCDAVVFSAGGGADGNVERKRTVDLEGSTNAIEAARSLHIHRFVQVSAIGVDSPPDESRGEAWVAYVHAKRDADVALRASGLRWTILRPGRLTDDEPSGHIALGEEVGYGSIPRADVAATIFACLRDPATVGKQWELVSGEIAIGDAVAAAV